MRYYVETPLEEFAFWSGAKYVADLINEQPNASEIWAYLENYLNDCGELSEGLSETNVNDFLWFDAEDFIKEAGLIKNDEDEKEEDNENDEDVLIND